jgi:Outer membrane protein beta-barrel domain
MKLLGVLFALVLPATALAQAPPPTGVIDEPLDRFAVDLQGSLANFPQDASIASSLGTIEENLPGRGLGGRVAAAFYPFRLGPVTFGLGGALAFARGSEQAEITGERFTTTFLAASPQLSLNFGRRRGWSYLGVGIGTARLTVAEEGAGSGPTAPTVDYGAGARWFVRDHVAFSFDFHFYNIAATDAEPGIAARFRTRMIVISAGISLK